MGATELSFSKSILFSPSRSNLPSSTNLSVSFLPPGSKTRSLPPLRSSMSSHDDESASKEAKLWGGRFEESVTEKVEKFTESISFDKALYKQDIMGSKAHATMLAHQGLMTDSDRDSILRGLDEIERKIEGDQFEWRTDREDVHMNIEAALTDLIGEPAKKLHTARSRNDQVATDFRLWCRDAIDTVIVKIKHLQTALVQLALKNEGLIVPGYTHLQRAQPVLLPHVLLTYVEQLERDAGRYADCRERLNLCPLGACALAGTGLPIDRFMTASALGFTCDLPRATPPQHFPEKVSARKLLTLKFIESPIFQTFSMGVKVAYTSPFLQWAAHPSSSSSSPSQTISSRAAISSPSKRRHSSPFQSCHFLPQRPNRSSLFGTPPPSTNLNRSKSCELWKPSTPTNTHSIRRVSSANLNPFSDEEFSKKIQELTLRFNHEREQQQRTSMDPRHEIEMKANSVDLPLSLRIIKKKKKKRRWEEEGGVVKQADGESAMSKAFSSMVFMIRELQSFTLHMREVLFYEDLRGILLRVREEMHASFVWLFQQVFSATPTLMVYVMLLLANFTVYSIGGNSALASAAPPHSPTTIVTELTTVSETNEKFDSSVVKTFFVSSPNGNTTSVGGNNNGGGGNIRPVLNGADGDDGSEQFGTIIPEGVSSTLGSTTAESEKASVSGQDELRLWNSIVEEAEQMQYSNTDSNALLDHETRKRFVSPLDARVEEADEKIDYFRTELLYQTGLSQEPNNPLLLANYAQFLYIVSNDYDRAEEYFKRAVGVEPKDAEALSKYATFLWRARDDLWAAEETFLEAIDADPTNSFYAANYANFLWNTGGDETCFPLDESQEDTI